MLTIQRNLVDFLSPLAGDGVVSDVRIALCPEAFRGTKVTHLAGARVKDVASVLRTVSEGGGTMLMKPSLEFVNLPLEVSP